MCFVTSSVVGKSDFLFIESYVQLAILMSFSEPVNLGDETYHLTGLVKQRSYHFTGAIAANLPTQEIIYGKDIQDKSSIFSSFQLFCQHTSGGQYFVNWCLLKFTYL